jgi:hypothetical protein
MASATAIAVVRKAPNSPLVFGLIAADPVAAGYPIALQSLAA